ncbi:MAG: zinc-ribbon domain-containing protein [Geobacteraceae bacterium]|nr:zinc-ribbon domain-containing protein [Geobacteraceae bacterium]
MGLLTVSCPSCGFSRQLPSEKVPDGPRRVTCPQCKETFVYDKSSPAAVKEEDSETGSAQASTTSGPPFTKPSPPEAPSASLDDFQGPVMEGSSATSSEDPPGPPTVPEMTDIGDLFRQSWDIYQKRFATLVLLYLLAMLAIAIPTALAVGIAFFMTLIAGGTAFFVTVSLGILAGIACFLWCYSGFLCAVLDDSLRLEDALTRGKRMILPLAWIFLLTGFIIIGGYLLLFIPGVIFTVWFFLAQFIMSGENVRGMDALLKSREYVRGYWLDVALRLFLIWVVSGVVSAIPFFGFILAVLFFPYLMIFHCLIYRDLRAIKGDTSCPCRTRNKLLWPGVALVGWIIIPIILMLLFGSLFCGKYHQGTRVQVETTRGESGHFCVATFPPMVIEIVNGV